MCSSDLKILMAKGFTKLLLVKYFTALRFIAKKIFAASMPRCAFVLIVKVKLLFVKYVLNNVVIYD